uniref:DDE Tnp4 domain-containing protein n=1 Tax=Lentinula edodes TaxID=5353 RepID=V9M2J7_LENED|nr:hypothetical protein [Lentinula edodes]
MGRDAFWHLHDLIAADAAFQSTANRPQRPVRYQLATFLCRVGAETAVKTASVMAVAEGSVYNYVQCVIGAIRRLRSDYLPWPGEARRHFISEKFAEQGFPGCLGTADGCLFRLTNQPLVNPYAYWCRKKFYAVSLIMQATVDHRGVFTLHELGWPGFVQDRYPLTKFTIRPFNDYDLTLNPVEARRRKKWNRQLSCMRIFVEHGFGRLKGRFPILRCIPSRHLGEAYKMIESLMIVHNILEVIGDDPYTITGFTGSGGEQEVTDSTVEVAERDADLEGDDFYRTGLLRRKLLMDKYSMF